MLTTPLQVQNRQIQCLTQTQAALRSSLVLDGSVNYHLRVKLLKGESYQGLVTVQFFALQTTDKIFLDFTGKQILGISHNGNSSPAFKWDGNFLSLPDVKQGQNQVEIYYENNYDNDGNGLHSFIDEDKKQYLYTNLAIIYCRRVFPSFDQPHLKGSFKLEAIAPSDWIVLSNEPTPQRQELSAFNKTQSLFSGNFIESVLENSDYLLSVFQESKPLSSYLFGIMAGPYASVKCEKTYHDIPMSLYTRESLMPHLRRISDFLFEVTNKCMEVYEEIFDFPFPFNKYDQIYVPEFNWGAMENAGIVTFNDIYVYREEVDSVKYTRLANTTAHELSHHWFGNLVTMKWWNDVWLNESFADFISHYCLSRITTESRPLSNIWVAFNTRKAWGYRTDEQITTHPIAGVVLDTNMAENVFDGITYAKGAATLRQLFSLVSVNHFTAAMKEYFTKFSYKNATLSDFITTVDAQFSQTGAQFSLSSWSQKWIQKAGLNKCIPIFNHESNSSESVLKVQQTYTLAIHPTLRTHKMKVAFFDKDANIAKVSELLLLDQEVTELVYDASQTQFSAVLLNYQDEAFIKISFDPQSIVFFKENLNKISCELSRTLIWQAFYNMVRDGDLSSEEYIDLFINHIELEKSDGLISGQLSFLETAFKSFTPRLAKTIIGDRIFEFLWKMLEACTPQEANKKLALISSLPSFAISEKSVRQLIEWYHGKVLLESPVGLKTQWTIIETVYKNKQIPLNEKQELFKLQSEKDKSDQVPLHEQFFEALNATPEQRQRIWERVIDPNNTVSNKMKDYSLLGIVHYSTTDERKIYHQRWIKELPYVFKNCKREFFKSFVAYLQPSQEKAEEEFDSALQLAIDTQVEEDVLQKVLLECQDYNKRVQKANATFLASTKLKLA